MTTRLERLSARVADAGLDALIVSQPENRRYLSGFTGSSGWLLISPDKALLATDSRYTEQAGHQAPAFQVVQVSGDLARWLPDLVAQLKPATRIGFEAADLPHASYKHWTESLSSKSAGVQLLPTEDLVEPLRMVKEPEEREAILQAVRRADAAMDAIVPTIEPGMTERQVAWRLEEHMREHGAEAVSFETIVAAGPNGAMAHHRPDDTLLQEGQPIVIDMGARVDGYCSDLTRTVLLGRPDDTFKRIYDTVLSAQLTAIATLRSGMTGDQGDALARSLIEKASYGDKFGHSLGHGVGLAIHEPPRLGKGSPHPLQDDMVFTVEPGIYITGWGGVRIEDVVELAKGSAVVLSTARKRDTVRSSL
ncbi:MAG: aminopeptidase P family protein [Chloroflexi bacterium]|nr:aminopeptidase P family protein [Chloroflexota bacterium]